jgi:hypothetical protein
MPAAADPLCLRRGEGSLQRFHGVRQVALRQRDEQAVHHGELGDPAGHGAGAEGGFACGGQQHEVRRLGDRGPREVRDRDRGGAVRAGLGKRVDGVDRGSGVRQADRDVALAAQRRGGSRHVRVGPGVAGPVDALQLYLQVDGHKAARADAVDVDPVRHRERVDDVDESADVESAGGLGDRGRVRVGDLLGDRHRVVVGVDIAGRRHDRGRVVVRHRSGQCEPQFRVPAQPDRATEPDHAGGRRAARAGQFGDAPPGHAARVVEHRLRHALLDRSQVRQQRANRDQDPNVPGRSARLGPGPVMEAAAGRSRCRTGFFGCHRPHPPGRPPVTAVYPRYRFPPVEAER